MAGDDGRCGVAVAVVLRAGRQNNQDFSAKITKISAKITKICVRYERCFARFLLRLPPWTSQPRSATLLYPPGHQTIATAPSCSSFSSPWDRWCLKRFSAAKSQWCVKLNHGQRKYDRLQWISGRYNHLQTPRNICSLEPPFHPLSNAPYACLSTI